MHLLALLRTRVAHTSLQGRLMLKMVALVGIQVVVSWALLSGLVSDLLREQIGYRALQTAQTVAEIPAIRAALLAKDTSGIIQTIADTVRLKVGARFVVVGDASGVRYSHPVLERIGQQFVGGDTGPALREGKSYVSEAVGTLGRSIRGMVPIFDDSGAIIGFVSVGYLTESVGQIVRDNMGTQLLVIGVLLAIGLAGGAWIAHRVKRLTLGLEPSEITTLYLEREAVLESIREGVAAVDQEGDIAMANKTALRHAGLDPAQPVRGRPVADILPDLDLARVLATGEAVHDRDFTMAGREFVGNVVPVLHEGRMQGAVATFRPTDELDSLARELSRVQEYTELLRVQAHEYSNKLHTIAGLLQIEAHQEALDLVVRESTGYQDMICFVQEAVAQPVIAAIIMGKYARAQELHIVFDVDRHSSFRQVPEWINQEKIVTILGNLLDNAFESVLDRPQEQRRATLSFTDLGNELLFEVEDSGAGVPIARTEAIFERGISGKGSEHRGVGLYLVRQCLLDLGGQVTVSDSELGGALFTVAIPKHRAAYQPMQGAAPGPGNGGRA